MKALRIALVLAFVAGALTVTSAFADGRRWHGHHGHRSSVTLGFSFGVPLYYNYPSYYYPAPVYYPPVVVQAPPQVYTERSDEAAAAPEAQQYWHYCASARGYYPYVKECPGGWERVPAAPSR